MMIDVHMYDEYKSFLDADQKSKLKLVDEECRSLMVWGIRNGIEVHDPGRMSLPVARVYEVPGVRYEEFVFEQEGWYLERAPENKSILSDLDVVISNSYKRTKDAGINGYHAILYYHYYMLIHRQENDHRWMGEAGRKPWRGANLVKDRLHSTARILTRVKNEQFGTRKLYKDGKLSAYVYTTKPLKLELVRRKVLTRGDVTS